MIIKIIVFAGDGTFTGVARSFLCTAGELLTDISQLCDGIAHCSGGDDEVTALCESMSYSFLHCI